MNQEIFSGHVGHDLIAQDDVDGSAREDISGLLSVGRFEDRGESELGQHISEDSSGAGDVVYDENGGMIKSVYVHDGRVTGLIISDPKLRHITG
ncbi:MAG: hypothetical protein RL518_69 [Pseudomonadota bacterium]